MRDAQVEILQMFANGLITEEQANRLMDALEEPTPLRDYDHDEGSGGEARPDVA